MKKCKICEKQKELIEFWKRKDRVDQYHPYCNECRIQKSRKKSKDPKEIERCRLKRRIQLGIENDSSRYFKFGPKPDPKTRHKNRAGYYIIYRPNHPNAQSSSKHRKGRIFEHVFIMSEHLGRPLKKGEHVHHINGIRDDNRFENLELWSTKHPAGQRIIDKILWCKEFLNEYGYDVIERR